MDNQERKEIRRIINTIGIDNLLDLLNNKIPLSDLNTLLLEVFRKITGETSPSELLKKYSRNRFVYPAEIHPIKLKQLEINTLTIADSFCYTPVQLSPVAPLGSCSAVAAADQNKIISALRGTEIVADATNLLALHICSSIKRGVLKNDEGFIRFCTTHRHVRAQNFNKPGLLPHFHLFCMVASGKDRGSYSFEKQALLEHINVYQKIFATFFNTKITVSLNSRSGYTDRAGLMYRMIHYIKEQCPDIEVIENTNEDNNQYYKGLQFSIIVNVHGQKLTIGDGGFVDWSQKLLGNKKERMMISAIGLERLLQ